MSKREYTIKDANGIHARPATALTQVASKFPNTTISISKDGKSVNLKSILGVMSLSVGQYQSITIEAVGKDDIKALDALENVLLEKSLI